ncbi:V-type proton ATPase 116 kDa subunit a 1-like [Eupeodes corollae]|uniref:V-type proton ATPase 116 kDa subunit a 1-like n=1 Tax=Eupeodes corollae TaxID=290404 RepID=UPI00248F686D|nr:V-type proton ATPase 116 kDa subunit a 1-like [Eupeodes corollae]XP_055902516.1 V-type proton ATPase 116 kDa subunit a 1-like [Eupeodes corollae]XP_055902518.1 V-type proton ATPase 116 kDa subunit a 1-like [Eupeodes corollae]
MGDMFRSETMVLCQMFIQPEAAYTSVSELGEAGCVQFRDLNDGINLFQRKFVTEVRRCDEWERKIRYIETELKKDGIKLPDIIDDIPRAPNPREIIDLEAHLEKTENEILELAQNEVNLKSNYLELTELRQVLENTETFFSHHEMLNLDSSQTNIPPTEYLVPQSRGRLAFVAGVINRERVFSFERMLWRISRGNVFLKRSDLDQPFRDPATGYPVYKTVFVAFFQGEELKNRIKKVCIGFHAAMYPCPSSRQERDEMIKGVRTRLEDLKMVLSQTEDHRNRVLATVSRNLPTWSIMVKKMKAIYYTLNLFNVDVTKKCLIGECWVSIKDLNVVQRALSDGSAQVGSSIPSFLNVINTNEPRPTFNRTNKFTQGFQNLIDAYGIASYREANPALYTIITFPFLFAVMFGDIGHGLIMLTFGAWMCIWEKQLSRKRGGSEIWTIFFGGRYIILLMGLFSLYTGFIYNDVFSKSMNVFGSAWKVHYDYSTVYDNPSLQLNPKNFTDGVYPMGLDPVWQLAENKIIFQNSYKMKLSIIFGVTHMLFGVFMSLVNQIHLKKWGTIFMEFLPQVLFLLLLFGYMAFMMFFKWVRYTAKTEVLGDSPGCAPSVLIMFINMMLFKSTPPLEGCSEFMFEGQYTLQMTFVAIGMMCIPWMLLAKPLSIQFSRRKNSNRVYDQNGADIPSLGAAAGGGEHGHGHGHENEPLSEIYIQQAIHTIEYVLSTISHTASYLRLWALSLAHAQLSEVLWGQLLKMGFSVPSYFIGPIMLYLIFAIWGFFTLAILVMMEGLSAFLHTLRLHWVEFMSKFYEGLGYAFTPFSFKVILNEQEEEKL